MSNISLVRDKVIELAIVVVNYKTPKLVEDCLASLLPELEHLNAKAVVVDNASMDDSVEAIQTWISENNADDKVELVASSENTGFSGGNNTGVKHLSAKYYLLLNSDTLVRQGSILKLLNAAKQDQTIGLVGPRLEWPDGQPQESCFRFHSPLSELISSANSGPITKLLNKFNVPYPVSDKQRYYDWTSFACVLVKSAVFDDIGLMDDGYFMYFEDVAFAYIAQQAGWKVLNVPDAHVVHLRGGSSPVKAQAKKRKRLPRYYYESRTRFFYQTYGRFGLLCANILWVLGWGISKIRQLFSSDYSSIVVENQWKDIWINFFNPLHRYIHPNTYK